MIIKNHQENILLFAFATLTTLLCCIYYLNTMLTISVPGFSLDDSWIHLQYARTIYEGIPWQYSPGYPSTGSTSPLWSVILSSIFLFTSDHYTIVWMTYGISIIFFVACSFIAGKIAAEYLAHTLWGFVVILGFVLIPRNAWLMLSGMETPLFMFILLLSIWILGKEEMKYDLLLGTLAGLAYLSRPEGILIALCIPIRFVILLVHGKVDVKRLGFLFLSGVFAVLVALPWIFHCLMTTGYPLPDTIYAKVHSPALYEIEAWNTWWPIFFSQMPFLPLGIFTGVILLAKGRPFIWLIPSLLTVFYGMNTPYAALINNARYLVPVFDLFFIAAVVSAVIIIKLAFSTILKLQDEIQMDIGIALIIGIILIASLIPTYTPQATQYGKAVGNINDMQVHIGYWLAENTPPDAVFATHDAGALRFFSGRVMIDVVGLVSPDIVHGNMTGLETLQYLYDHGCNYFVMFDDVFLWWSQYLPLNATSKIYTVTLAENVISGRDTMSVYHIDWELTDFPANSE